MRSRSVAGATGAEGGEAVKDLKTSDFFDNLLIFIALGIAFFYLNKDTGKAIVFLLWAILIQLRGIKAELEG